MGVDLITISSTAVGQKNTFVYCIYITKPKPAVYIGETMSKHGALGRLIEHIQKGSGTFIKKCLEKLKIDLDECDCTISMLAFNLFEYPEYCGDVNRQYRRALEYHINGYMEELGVSDDVDIPFDVISWTNTCYRLSENEKIKTLAKQIAQHFYNMLPFSCSDA